MESMKSKTSKMSSNQFGDSSPLSEDLMRSSLEDSDSSKSRDATQDLMRIFGDEDSDSSNLEAKIEASLNMSNLNINQFIKPPN